jgi:hypothetical protein
MQQTMHYTVMQEHVGASSQERTQQTRLAVGGTTEATSVQTCLEDVTAQIDIVAQLVMELTQKLHPVLRVVPPRERGAAALSAAECPLTDQLRTVTQRVQALGNLVRGTIDALAL